VWRPSIFSDITSDLSLNIKEMNDLSNLILLNIFNKYDEIFCNDYSIEKYVQQESFEE
jgi:hypothetical protein